MMHRFTLPWVLIACMGLWACTYAPMKASDGAVAVADSQTVAPSAPPRTADTVVAAVQETGTITAPPPQKGKEHRLKGKFVEMEEGDYLHFVVQDDADGEEKSFYLMERLPMDQWMPFDTSLALVGHPVEITWRTANRFLEAAGAVNRIEEVTSIKLLK
jgi:hypothetical protein